MSSQDPSPPNILLVMTDQLRYPPSYESEELQQFRRAQFTGEESLRTSGVSFLRHYTMSAACAPSRASFLTGHYPSLHGVTQTDGLAKSADSSDMFWLALATGADPVDLGSTVARYSNPVGRGSGHRRQPQRRKARTLR